MSAGVAPSTQSTPDGATERWAAADLDTVLLEPCAPFQWPLDRHALATAHFQDASYTTNAREFSYVTQEDEMNGDATEPSRNQFSFGPGDRIVDFVVQNGMKVKGHTLV